MSREKVIWCLEYDPPDHSSSEILMAFLNAGGAKAIEEGEQSLRIYDRQKKVLEDLVSFIDDTHAFEGLKWDIYTLPDENWNKSWESSFNPITIGTFCHIRASFHPPYGQTTYELVIDPEMAFGTGHHETTYLMIQAMEALHVVGKKVLDYGCGTGILAILASQLGASEVVAIDYDEMAIKCAEQCVLQNRAQGVKLISGEISALSSSTKYDIILANINKHVLLNSADLIHSLLANRGLVLLSGILLSDDTGVTEAYLKAGFQKMQIFQKNEWISILFRKD